MEEAHDTPASDLLRADHRKIEKHLDSLLDALKHLSAGRLPEIRRDFAAIQKLSQLHFAQEEQVFYPAVRPLAPQVLAQMDDEHAAVRETEQGLEEILRELLESISEPPTARHLGELYRLGIEFHDAVEVHILDEEDYLLKLVDRLITSAEQQNLAAAMLRVEGPLLSSEA